MKTLLKFCLALMCAGSAFAAPHTRVFLITTQNVTIPATGYDVTFEVAWFGDPNPDFSAPGRVELRNSSGTLVGYTTATVNRDTGPDTVVTLGSLRELTWSVSNYATDEGPALGLLQAKWRITGVPAGNYTLRFFEYVSETWATFEQPRSRYVWTETSFIEGSDAGAGTAPVITWSVAPGSAENNQSYTVSAHGHDDDGDLTQINVWKNGQPFASASGGNGTDGDSGNFTTDSGPQTVSFTAQAVDATGATSPVITHTVTIGAPVNSPPTVTLSAPGAQSIPVGTALTITSRATDSDGNITAHNLDIQRPAGDWNFQGGFATGEPFQGGPVGNGGDSTRTASFTFTDVGTYYVRSAANDGSGWYQSATVAITVVSAPPVQYLLMTTAGAGGSVTSGGLFTAGTSTTVSAMPDAFHDFVGWNGDAGGASNPLTILLDRSKTVQAVFAPKSYALLTSATVGGAVTPGGTYPPGTTITITAAPDAMHRFLGWAGDASGTVSTVAILLDAPKTVQAVFTDKTAQTLTFPTPVDQPVVGPPLTLNASVSSGLPVSFVVLSGPATLNGNQLVINGPGAVTIQASQPGDGVYLPAPSVTRTFNAYATALLRYQPNSRTLLQSRAASGAAPYVVQTP